jgi:hypothetical protein
MQEKKEEPKAEAKAQPEAKAEPVAVQAVHVAKARKEKAQPVDVAPTLERSSASPNPSMAAMAGSLDGGSVSAASDAESVALEQALEQSKAPAAAAVFATEVPAQSGPAESISAPVTPPVTPPVIHDAPASENSPNVPETVSTLSNSNEPAAEVGVPSAAAEPAVETAPAGSDDETF